MEPEILNTDTTAELLNHPKYKKIKDINRGAFGVVVLAEERATGQQVAIKFIKRGPRVTKYVLREILNHRSLIHPHIVQFKEVFLTKRCLATAMEYCNGGDMLDYVVKRGGLPETSSRWFFQQLVSAVDYLHKMGFASRDIKLDNVLLDDSRRPLMKLCDFGYSKHERDSAPGSTVGTPAYLAPEVIRASEKEPYDAKLADIWSCGVFLYAATIGTYPFYRPQDRGNPKEVQLMIQRILKLQYKIPENGDVSPELRDLLSKMLVDDPQQRISMRGIQAHPWYLTDLPEGVADMNDELPLPGDDVQPLAEMEAILHRAAQPLAEPPRKAAAPGRTTTSTETLLSQFSQTPPSPPSRQGENSGKTRSPKGSPSAKPKASLPSPAESPTETLAAKASSRSKKEKYANGDPRPVAPGTPEQREKATSRRERGRAGDSRQANGGSSSQYQKKETGRSISQPLPAADSRPAAKRSGSRSAGTGRKVADDSSSEGSVSGQGMFGCCACGSKSMD